MFNLTFFLKRGFGSLTYFNVLNDYLFLQILSGDAVVIRGQPHGGPPKERTICLSNITAPRLARRANPKETKDEVNIDI